MATSPVSLTSNAPITNSASGATTQMLPPSPATLQPTTGAGTGVAGGGGASFGPAVVTAKPAVANVQKQTTAVNQMSQAVTQQNAKVSASTASAATQAAAQKLIDAQNAKTAAANVPAPAPVVKQPASAPVKSASGSGVTAENIPVDPNTGQRDSTGWTQTGTDANGNSLWSPPGTTGSSQNSSTGNNTGSYSDQQAQSQAAFSAAKKTADDKAQSDMETQNAKLDQIANGTYPLTDAQQAQLNGIKASYQNMIAEQSSANTNYESAVKMAGISAGRNMYAPEVELGNVKKATDEGLAKISDLNDKMNSALAAAKQAIADDDTKLLDQQYANIVKLQDQKNQSISDLYKASTDALNAAKMDADQKRADAQFQFQVTQAAQQPIEQADARIQQAVISFAQKYPDAGITAQDSLQSASDKVKNSATYKEEAAKAGNPSIAEQISAMNAGGSIVNGKFVANADQSSSTILGAADQGSVWQRDGKPAPECGQYVNDVAGTSVGDSLASKTAIVDKSITTPKVGDVVITNEGGTANGHIAIVNNVNGNTITVSESNYKKGADGVGIVTNDRTMAINASQIQGYAHTKLTDNGDTATAPGTTGSAKIDSTAPGYTTKAIASAGGMTQAAIDKAAYQLALTGTMPAGIGRSSTGAGLAKANAIQARAAELGGDSNVAVNKSKVAALSSAYDTTTADMTKMQIAVDSADNSFKQVAQAFATAGLNTADSTLQNKTINDLTKQFGSSGDIRALQTALTEVGNDYAAVFAAKIGSDAATRQRSQDIFNGNIKLSDLQKTADELQSMGKINIQAKQSALDDINSKMNNILTPPTSGAAQPQKPTEAPPSGQIWVSTKDGQIGSIPESEYDANTYTKL